MLKYHAANPTYFNLNLTKIIKNKYKQAGNKKNPPDNSYSFRNRTNKLTYPHKFTCFCIFHVTKSTSYTPVHTTNKPCNIYWQLSIILKYMFFIMQTKK